MTKVLTIGEILVEIMAKNIGQSFLTPGNLLGPFPSGAPAIFIDQVAKMNVECGIISVVGDDDFGALNRNRLENDGVDTTQIITNKNHTTGTAFVSYLNNGDRKFIYHFTHSAAGQLSYENINEEYLSNADYLHIMGCSLSASSSLRNAIYHAIEAAKKENICISFDPNLRPELLEIKHIQNVFYKVLAKTDIILSGKDEITRILNMGKNDVLEFLFSKGTEIIVLRDGSCKVEAYTRKENYIYLPPQVNEIDPTGAGDCFDGVFIASMAKDLAIDEAIKYSSVAGALSVMEQGPMEGTKTQKEIEDFIDENNI